MADDPQSLIEELVRRVSRLEVEFERLRAEVAASEPPPNSVAHPDLPRPTPDDWTPPPVAAWPPPEPVVVTAREPRSFILDSETVLKWGGVALVVLAVGFAVSTAISRGWIGPQLQLAGALVVSFGLIATGVRLRSSRPPWTHALCSGGVLALYTTVASNLFLDQASDDVAFAATIAIGLGSALLAWFVRSEWVAGAALLGGVVGWFVIGDGEPPLTASTVWVVAVVAGSLALAIRHGWFAVRLLAHATGLVALLALGNQADGVREPSLVLVAAALLTVSLWWVPSIGRLTSAWQQLELQVALIVPPWALAMIALALDLDDEAEVGWVGVAVAAAAGLAAAGVRRWLRPAHFVSLAVGASVTLSIGLALLLSATAAFVALAVQGAGLVVLARALGGSVRVLVNAAAVLVVAAGAVIGRMIDAWDDDASVGDDVAHLAIIVALAVAGWQTRHRTARRGAGVVVLVFVLVWLGSVLVHLPQGQAAVSVSWAIVGTALLVGGAVGKLPEVAAAGLTVLAATVGKLLTVDLREVDTLWRAGLFLVVGLGLMRLGFLLPRLTRDADPDTPAEG